MARILVVDDDGFSRTLLADHLRAMGHTISVGSDAREGLQALGQHAHDGVITDVRMPGWDGIEFARRIAQLPDAPPVILMSAEPDFDIHEEALRRGVRPLSFLQKPFERATIQRAANLLTRPDDTAPTGAMRPDVATVPLGKDELPDWLTGARGSVRQLAPMRVWYVAWRRQATGAVVVRNAAETTLIGLKRGQIVEVAGLPALLRSKLPAGVVADNLTAAVGGAMANGLTLDDALSAVSTDVARWMLAVRAGDVRFDGEWTPGSGAIPLPGLPIKLLSDAIAEVPPESLQKAWQAVASAKAHARAPSDVPGERWGLDAQLLRAHRLASGQAVQALVYELSSGAPDRRLQVIRALDLLMRLNLITLGA